MEGGSCRYFTFMIPLEDISTIFPLTVEKAFITYPLSPSFGLSTVPLLLVDLAFSALSPKSAHPCFYGKGCAVGTACF